MDVFVGRLGENTELIHGICPESIAKRFWSKVIISDGCWKWTAAKNKGYGQLSGKRNKAPFKAHRISWLIHFGEIKSNQEVCHRCDNPECTNPDHLFLGTHKENMIDAYKKGRLNLYHHGCGEDNNAAKLTNEQVKQIREEYANGSTVNDLIIKYKNTNIVRIVRNQVYVDKNYKPINGNAKPRPHRRALSVEQRKEIAKSKKPSRKLAKIYGVSKATILEAKRNI